MRLFKSEGVSCVARGKSTADRQDEKPIQVVPLGQNAKVSQRYEESQVQGSFKVIDQSGEVGFGVVRRGGMTDDRNGSCLQTGRKRRIWCWLHWPLLPNSSNRMGRI
jgi:hypothetical protein